MPKSKAKTRQAKQHKSYKTTNTRTTPNDASSISDSLNSLQLSSSTHNPAAAAHTTTTTTTQASTDDTAHSSTTSATTTPTSTPHTPTPTSNTTTSSTSTPTTTHTTHTCGRDECNKPASHPCATCASVYYCSIDCATQHRQQHKPTCKQTKTENKLKKQIRKETTVKACQQCKKTQKTLGHRLLTCGKCKFTYYCSEDCQRHNWLAHKGAQCAERLAQRTAEECAAADDGGRRAYLPMNPSQVKLQELVVQARRCKKSGDKGGLYNALSEMGQAYLNLSQYRAAFVKFEHTHTHTHTHTHISQLNPLIYTYHATKHILHHLTRNSASNQISFGYFNLTGVLQGV